MKDLSRSPSGWPRRDQRLVAAVAGSSPIVASARLNRTESSSHRVISVAASCFSDRHKADGRWLPISVAPVSPIRGRRQHGPEHLAFMPSVVQMPTECMKPEHAISLSHRLISAPASIALWLCLSPEPTLPASLCWGRRKIRRPRRID